MIFRRIAQLFAFVLASVSLSPGTTTSDTKMGVLLELTSDKQEYVAKESVKLNVTMTNTSTRTIRIPDVEFLAQNMEYMYYEIGFPDGEVQTRRYQYVERNGPLGNRYTGEPLRPGQSIRMFLYPNVTTRYPLMSSDYFDKPTFKSPGRYRIRVHYRVPNHEEELWKPLKGSVASNAVTLDFREPTVEEAEILDAIWAGDLGGPGIGDFRVWRYDEEALRDVISRYPDNPLIKHAHLALARSYVYHVDDEETELRAATILEMMMTDYPDFRYEEVHQHLATAYFRAEQRARAARILEHTLRERPYLEDNHFFMALKIGITYGPGDAFPEWRRCRREGDRFDEAKFKRWEDPNAGTRETE